MRAQKLMSADVASCRPEDSMAKAARLMWDRDCGIVPVVDSSRKVLGIVTDRDICIAALTKGRTLADMAVAEVMRREVYTCRETQSAERIHALLRKHQVRRLPVVGEAGTLVGIVSINDLALAAADETGDARHRAMIEVAETLAAICCHREPVLH